MHKVCHLHKTRPNHLHIRAFHTIFPLQPSVTLVKHILLSAEALTRSSSNAKCAILKTIDPDYRPLLSQLYISVYISVIQRNLAAVAQMQLFLLFHSI